MENAAPCLHPQSRCVRILRWLIIFLRWTTLLSWSWFFLQATEGVAPTSPMTLPLHHGLHVRFVASWATLPFGAINGRIRHLHLNLSTIHRLITLPLPCLLKTTATSIPGQLITLPVSSSIFFERLQNSKIRSVQTDWGGEYHNLHTYFQSIGIIHRVSCPHTHQQEGCAERKHCHLTDTTLALLADSYLPKTF